MTATEELRRMLDERGVEWLDDSYAQLWCTVWDGQDGKQWRMTENQSGMLTELKAWKVTPEQAIAATLGAGTCQDLGGTGANDEQVFNCSECGCVLSLYDRDGSNNLCTSFIFDYPRYCPECGRKVVTNG